MALTIRIKHDFRSKGYVLIRILQALQTVYQLITYFFQINCLSPSKTLGAEFHIIKKSDNPYRYGYQ
jgi:hypothetical protein